MGRDNGPITFLFPAVTRPTKSPLSLYARGSPSICLRATPWTPRCPGPPLPWTHRYGVSFLINSLALALGWHLSVVNWKKSGEG